MNSIIDKYIASSNQPKHTDGIVRIVPGGEVTPADFLQEAVATDTLNNYIKCNNNKKTINQIIIEDMFDEYGFAKEDEDNEL